ncbi:aspartate/glutamate racemase family protein [Marinomonas sp. GJ51-6]|uniref:aspartate/glutamate racemase family protein n=1 Tax=Marinomonas sp. GJ51-6 TaxID=2992802 RepID=UPI00293424E3|nr:aspartate/glutamate racemase family protein [Marinomonas sp. GJ51-6]WOD09167.1 aspartate/glutamate racemase family protein [Marinomonas sp. GJ51-6]
MLIQLINPNTSTEMTAVMAASAVTVALPTTKIMPSTPLHGPKSIECALDETIASAALLDLIQEGKQQGVDAHIIACFGDPALDAARELADAPVIGIAEAAFQLASLISHRFGIVTTLSRTLPASEHLLQKYGHKQHCSGVRASDIPVLELENLAPEAYQLLKNECLEAINLDGAEAIVLGCAGMSNLVEKLSQELPVPIIDGVTAAVKLAESLHQLGLRTSKAGHYGKPLQKPFIGRYSHWGV